MDPRIRQLAENLLKNSVCLQKGEKLFIDAAGSDSYPLVEALIDGAYAIGAHPSYVLGYEWGTEDRILRAFLRGASKKQMEFEAEQFMRRITRSDAYIRFSAKTNAFEMQGVPEEQMALFNKIMEDGVDHRVDNTRWCVLRWPTPAMAQAAGMSTEEFEEFYFKCCLLDYSKMSHAMDSLAALMRITNKVHITGPGTDLRFSIKDIPVIKCAGTHNVPDGETYTAPRKYSVNGELYYTAPTIYESKRFSGIRLVFRKGRIVEATCEQGSNEELNAILDRDAGARYVGEFALGVNPHITKAMLSILFDEKIAGSFHFTSGQCYEEASNGNDKSAVHWDMVCVQTPEYGGGEIWFDGKLIRKDGLFVLPELEGLNPENLK